MRQLTLKEYRPSDPVTLEQNELEALMAIRSLQISPTGIEGEWVITPGSEIGAIELPGLSLVIEPKLEISRVLFLISYALDPKRWLEDDFMLPRSRNLVEALVPAFVSHVRRALSRGILQGYQTEEDSLTTIRGRVLFDEQIRRRYGVAPPIEVRFDEFTEDIEANRLIKAAIRRLGRMRLRSDWSRRSLRYLDLLLDRVRHIEYHASAVPVVTYTRLNEHYRPAVELARLILQGRSLELGHGKARGTGFLVDMNKVFENFVVVALRETLRQSPRAFPQGMSGRSLYMAHGPRIPLKPDMSWWVANDCVFVGDVKYKRLDIAGYQNADLYQLLAYSTAADLPGGLLIYAKGERPEASYQVRHAGKTLEVVTLELDGTPDAIRAQMRDLAKRVVTLRRRALSEADARAA